MRPGTRPLVYVEDFIPETRDEARQLFDALMALDDVLPGLARGVVGTLQTLPEGKYPRGLSVILTSYRKHLARIDDPPRYVLRKRAKRSTLSWVAA